MNEGKKCVEFLKQFHTILVNGLIFVSHKIYFGDPLIIQNQSLKPGEHFQLSAKSDEFCGLAFLSLYHIKPFYCYLLLQTYISRIYNIRRASQNTDAIR